MAIYLYNCLHLGFSLVTHLSFQSRDREIHLNFVFQANKRHSIFLGCNNYGIQFPCFWTMSMSLWRFRITCWRAVNSCSLWYEPSLSYATICAILRKWFLLHQSGGNECSRQEPLKHILSLIATSPLRSTNVSYGVVLTDTQVNCFMFFMYLYQPL